MREASKGSNQIEIISKIAKRASNPLNEWNVNGCRTAPRRARGKKTHGRTGRGLDQNPHRPYPRPGRGQFQRVLRQDLYPWFREKLRRRPQAGRHGFARRAGCRTGPHGKIQRAAAVGGTEENHRGSTDVGAGQGELETWLRGHRRHRPRLGGGVFPLGLAFSQEDRSAVKSSARRLSTGEFRRHAAAAETVIEFTICDIRFTSPS